MLESELELSLKKSLRIKEDKMAALEVHLQESSKLNQQLHQELSAVSETFAMGIFTQRRFLEHSSRLTCAQVKLSYEALHQRQEELTVSCSTPPGDTGRVMTEWLRESQEATKELLKLKDHLVEVERNASDLSLSGSKHFYFVPLFPSQIKIIAIFSFFL